MDRRVSLSPRDLEIDTRRAVAAGRVARPSFGHDNGRDDVGRTGDGLCDVDKGLQRDQQCERARLYTARGVHRPSLRRESLKRADGRVA
jgi:hypothetical protein